jgi:serine/threonine protein kinase KIN1/2
VSRRGWDASNPCCSADDCSAPLLLPTLGTMATTTSVSPAVERTSSTRHHQPQSTPSRSQSTRTRSTAAPLNPQRTTSTGHHRSSLAHGAVEEVLPQNNYETMTGAQISRRSSSKDRQIPSRSDSQAHSGHHRQQHSRQSTDMSTTVANGVGPAPVVVPVETRHTGRSSGKSRTTIPAQTGNWVLGKTIGAGSMGKVKLARRVEGGEQVCFPSAYALTP